MCEKKNSTIIKRIYIGIEVKFIEPLCVSSGLDELTDNDLQRDVDGNVFIPGTSLAGAMRGYLEEKEAECLFGYEHCEKGQEDGKMSSLIVSDLTFEEGCRLETSERDGVGLEKKVAQKGKKFSVEIIEAGAVGAFHIGLTIRENGSKDEECLKALLKKIFFGMQEGDIRFGAKKNRGFGRLEIEKMYVKEFTRDNVNEWIEYGHKDQILFADENVVETDEWTGKGESKYIKLSVPLELTGGISIRRYAVNGNADFEHVHSKDTPVVPGTSWAGAIRERIKSIAIGLFGLVKSTDFIEKWFGYVNEETKEASQSAVVFGESRIKGGLDLEITRNRINRFDNSTINGALYTEKGLFTGSTDLNIWVKRDLEADTHEVFIALLLLAIRDLQNGYLAVGGQTSVGRGIFKGGIYSISLDDVEFTEESYLHYIEKLKSYIGGQTA